MLDSWVNKILWIYELNAFGLISIQSGKNSWVFRNKSRCEYWWFDRRKIVWPQVKTKIKSTDIKNQGRKRKQSNFVLVTYRKYLSVQSACWPFLTLHIVQHHLTDTISINCICDCICFFLQIAKKHFVNFFSFENV